MPQKKKEEKDLKLKVKNSATANMILLRQMMEKKEFKKEEINNLIDQIKIRGIR